MFWKCIDTLLLQKLDSQSDSSRRSEMIFRPDFEVCLRVFILFIYLEPRFESDSPNSLGSSFCARQSDSSTPKLFSQTLLCAPRDASVVERQTTKIGQILDS